jgi:hypothetical protein
MNIEQGIMNNEIGKRRNTEFWNSFILFSTLLPSTFLIPCSIFIILTTLGINTDNHIN